MNNKKNFYAVSISGEHENVLTRKQTAEVLKTCRKYGYKPLKKGSGWDCHFCLLLEA